MLRFIIKNHKTILFIGVFIAMPFTTLNKSYAHFFTYLLGIIIGYVAFDNSNNNNN